MNTDDRGRNHAEGRHFAASQTVKGPDGRTYPLHRGYPDPRCACAGTGWITEGDKIIACAEHERGPEWLLPVPAVSDPRGLPDVDWEGVAGRAMAELQAAANELKRLRRHMPALVLREYDRRYHAGT